MYQSALQRLAEIPDIGLPLALAWALYLLLIGLWIIWEKREPAATLGWLLALAALPFLGFLIYYLIGPRRIRRQRLRRLRTRAELASRAPDENDDSLRTQFAQLAKRSTGLSASHMIDPVLLHNGEHTYPAMLEAIAEARHHIHMASYIYAPDESGRAIRDALIAKAREGVTVRLLLDSVGSSSLRPAFFKDLIAAGGEVGWFHPVRFRPLRRSTINHRSHRKILIVDARIGFTGGVNICDAQDHRRRSDAHTDLHLRFGGTAVQGLQLTFIEDWAYATGQVPQQDKLWPPPVCGGAPALVIPSGPDTGWEAFHRISVEAIHQATSRVWLATPYFVPTEAARMALSNAALRGLDVRLMLPQQADSRLVSAAARSYYDEMLAAGVRIFEYQARLLHAKAMLLDNEHVLIGSDNFDNRSFRLNFELSVLVSDPALARALEHAWIDYASRAQEVRAERRPSRIARMGDAIARLFSPLL